MVRDAILQAFNALRETFLEELDLEEPHHPLLISGARRLKIPGADVAALVMQDSQRRQLARQPQTRPDIDTMLAGLRDNEATNAGAPATSPVQKPQGT
jgi:hypothetical protein